MDKQLQGKAIQEILNGCDVIIASTKKGVAEKVGKELGGTLYNMGVRNKEAEVLFEFVHGMIFDNPDDTNICFVTYEYDEELDGKYIDEDSE